MLTGCLSGAAKEAMEELDEEGGERSNCDDVLEALEDRSVSGSSDTKLRIQLCKLVAACAREKPATWRSRASRLCALAIRAGGGEIGRLDGSAAHMDSAVAELAAACGLASGADLIGSIRSELVAPLRLLPARGWLPQTPPCSRLRRRLRACAHPRTPRISCDYPRWWLRVQPRRACARDSSRFPLFPAGRLSAPLEDGDVQLLLSAALPPVAADPGGSFTVAALAAAAAVLEPVNSSDAAAREARVPRRVSRRFHPGRRRRRQTFERTRRVSWRFSPGVGARWNRAMWWLPHSRASIPARRSERRREGFRVTHAGGGCGDVTLRSLPRRQSRASAAPGRCRRRGAARCHSGGDHVASGRELCRRARERTVIRGCEELGESTGMELMGDWTEADIEGFDDALNAEDSHAAAQAIARLAAVGIDANGTPVAKGDAVVEEEELFDLD